MKDFLRKNMWRITFLVIAAAVMALVSDLAKADSLIIHGRSHHTVGEYNDNNPGIGYVSDRGYAVGYYRNSERSDTFYVGYKYTYSDKFSVVFAAASGYRNTPVMPIIMPTYSLNLYKDVYFNLGVAPLFDDTTKKPGILFHTMLEFRF
jgi:hypothetical protein